MASKIALFVLFNILFFTMVSSTNACPHCYKPPEPKCPKLAVCADLLGDLLRLRIGAGAPTDNYRCCGLLQGLADLDTAVCLCTAIKANVLGIDLNVPVSIKLLLNNCGKEVPHGFECA